MDAFGPRQAAASVSEARVEVGFAESETFTGRRWFVFCLQAYKNQQIKLYIKPNMLRRLVALARSRIAGEVSSLVDLKGFMSQEQKRFLSQVPKDYQGYYQKQVLQPKRPPKTSPVAPEKAAEEASTSGREASPADVQLQSAQAGNKPMLVGHLVFVGHQYWLVGNWATELAHS